MEGFSIKSENGNFLSLSFQEVYGFPHTTCPWGGYDVRAFIEIKSNSFYVHSILFTSTGEIFKFWESLLTANEDLRGELLFSNYENQLEFTLRYTDSGHIILKGKFSDSTEFDNCLQFEFPTDQSFLNRTIQGLKNVTLKYGGMQGVKE